MNNAAMNSKKLSVKIPSDRGSSRCHARPWDVKPPNPCSDVLLVAVICSLQNTRVLMETPFADLLIILIHSTKSSSIDCVIGCRVCCPFLRFCGKSSQQSVLMLGG